MNPKEITPTTIVPESKQVHNNANHSHHKSDSNNSPSSSVSNGQDAATHNVSSPPNDNNTTLSPQKKHDNPSTPSSHSIPTLAEDTFSTVRQYPIPVDFLPNIKPNINPITGSVSRRPLQEIVLPGTPSTPTIVDNHSINNRSSTITDDDNNNANKENIPPSSKKLSAYIPFNAVPSSDVLSPNSSGFQANINMPGGGYPSSTPIIPPIRIGHVEQFTTAFYQAVHNHCNASFKSKHHDDNNINADQQPDGPAEVYQKPTPTLESYQQPNNTVGDDQQPKQTIGDLLQQAALALDAEQQAASTLDAQQQVGPIANDSSDESLRLRFINLHLRHMEFLENEMKNLAPIRTLL
ncbi:hypothetical protein BG015_000292, partial [Linnemannia schmuckeri]